MCINFHPCHDDLVARPQLQTMLKMPPMRGIEKRLLPNDQTCVSFPAHVMPSITRNRLPIYFAEVGHFLIYQHQIDTMGKQNDDLAQSYWYREAPALIKYQNMTI